MRQAKEGQTWDPGWFAHFRDAGWTGALVPTAFGGLDLDPLSVALIFEELGRGAVPSPLLASSAIATCLLLACQQSERRDAALTAIADGGMILIPALRKPETSWNGVAATCTSLTREQRNWVLTGSKVFVPFADAATHFLVSVVTSGDVTPALAIVPAGTAGIATRLLPGFLQANHAVSFDNVAVAESDIVRAGDRIVRRRIGRRTRGHRRLSSGRDARNARHVRGPQQYARAIRHTDRPISTGAGPHHPIAECDGCRPMGDL